jgi:hypothetical protein
MSGILQRSFLTAVSFLTLMISAFAQTPTTQTVTADDIRAQRSFSVNNGRAVSMDFRNVTLEMNFNPSAERTNGRAVIEFSTLEQGFPYFLLGAPIQSVKLDGNSVSVRSTTDRAGLNRIQLVSQAVSPGIPHVLEVEYRVSNENITYRNRGIGFVTSMADIDEGNFLETYAPSNFEDDQYPMIATLNLVNGGGNHRLFTNGTVTQNGPTTWRIEFPAYFNTSSFYFHLSNRDFAVRTGVYQGLERPIPFTVYSTSVSAVNSAAAEIPKLFQELESTYGPYFHQSFTAYISGSGGMEHSGATITSLSALGHELTHSWFARGVQPSSGSSGWIDEGIASWRDQGYRRQALIGRQPANLAGFSIFERFTPYAAYTRGEQFMRELDARFSQQFGGLRPLLASFFAQFKGQLITTSVFENWLGQTTGENLGQIFQRYIYGDGQFSNDAGAPGAAAGVPLPNTNHPPALTASEVEAIR